MSNRSEYENPSNPEEVNQIIQDIEDSIDQKNDKIKELHSKARKLGRYDVIKFRDVCNEISPLKNKISDLEILKKKLNSEKTKLIKGGILKSRVAYKSYTQEVQQKMRNDYYDFKYGAKLKKQNMLSDRKEMFTTMRQEWDKTHEEKMDIYNKRKIGILNDCNKMKYFLKKKKNDVDNSLREGNQKKSLIQRTEKEVARLRKADNLASIIGNLAVTRSSNVMPQKSLRMISTNKSTDVDPADQMNTIQEDQGCFRASCKILPDLPFNKVKEAFKNNYPTIYKKCPRSYTNFSLKSSRLNIKSLYDKKSVECYSHRKNEEISVL